MSKPNFIDGFKLDVIKQIGERYYSVSDILRRLGVRTHSSYTWVKWLFSSRANKDIRQTILVKDAWRDSGEIYGCRNLHDDLRISVRFVVRTVW